jgi:hypothetical protein
MPTNTLFQLSFPDGWEETTVFTYNGPFDSGVQHNLVLSIVSGQDKEMDVKTFAKGCLKASSVSLPGFEMINETEGNHPLGVPMYIVVYKYSPSDQVSYFQKQYYLMINGKAYIFTATFSKKTLKSMATVVDQVVGSLKVQRHE